MSDWKNRMRAQIRPLAVELAQINLTHQLLIDDLNDLIPTKIGAGHKRLKRIETRERTIREDIALAEQYMRHVNNQIDAWISDNGRSSPSVHRQRMAIFSELYNELITVQDDDDALLVT